MSDYEPKHDRTTGQFTEQAHSTPEKPLIPEQHISTDDLSSYGRRMPALFQQNLSDEQADRLCQARNYHDDEQPFIQPSSVQGPGGLPEPAPVRAYFIHSEDLHTSRLLIEVDGTVTEYESRLDGQWRPELGDYMLGQLRQPLEDDQEVRNSFSDMLTARQDRVLLRFNEYRYCLNTCTRPDGQGGVEAINYGTDDDNDGLRRIRINAEGFVTSIATMDESTDPEPTWVEWDAESEEFGAIANDRMTYEEQVEKSSEIKAALAAVKARTAAAE